MTLTLIAALLLTAPSLPNTANDDFSQLVERYAAAYWQTYPTAATSAGVHTYDGQLERFDAKQVQARLDALWRFADQLAVIDTRKLSPALALDHRILSGHVADEIARWQEDRVLENHPSLYIGVAGEAVDELLKHSFAPLCDRLRLAARRAMEVPRVFTEARANLKRPPRVWTEIAISDSDGAVMFFGTVLPKAAESCADQKTQKMVQDAAAKARAAVEAYRVWLKSDLLPRSDGNYVLGAARFGERLARRELITEPLPALLERGEKELAHLQAEFNAVARRIDAKRTPAETLVEISKLHPPAEALIASTREMTAEIRKFVIDHHIVEIPPGEDLHIEETPLFYRQLSFASMATPGPFEDKAREAYFYVTPVEPTWSDKQKEEHLRAFDRFSQENTVIHEAYPGHYVQGLYERLAPTLTRKLFSSTTLSEGWALYAERMLLDEGYDPDPRERLIMLQWALIRAARYVASIRMHALGASFDDIVEFLKKNAFLEQANAEREAKRYTSDTTVMAYTYGQLVIDAVRKEVAKREGGRFKLGAFHKKLLMLGPVPAAVLSEAMK